MSGKGGYLAGMLTLTIRGSMSVPLFLGSRCEGYYKAKYSIILFSDMLVYSTCYEMNYSTSVILESYFGLQQDYK
jgi:hypothetical protein